MAANLNTEEAAALVPCFPEDVEAVEEEMLLAAIGGRRAVDGKLVLVDDTPAVLQKLRELVAAEVGAYTKTPTCKVCGAQEEYHRCCTKCDGTATGFTEVQEAFGFVYDKKKHRKRSLTICRECYREYHRAKAAEKKAGKTAPKAAPATVPVEVKKAAAEEAKEEAAEVAMMTAKIVEIAAAPVIASVHRRPYETTVPFSGKVETLNWGPIKLDVRETNTVEGATMIPDIDPHFSLDPDEAIVIANALKSAEPTWIWGPSGVGKTSGVRQAAALLNWPLYRVQMSADFSLDDFVGTTEVVVDEATGQGVTQFKDGVLIRAMLNGGILLVDEITGTPPHVLLALQAVLERVEDPAAAWAAGKAHCAFVNTANGGEVVHAHPDFRIIVTDNTNGQGDVMGLYAGTNVMNEASRSRFSQWFRKDFPSKDVWERIVRKKTGVTHTVAQQIVEIARTVNAHSRVLSAKVGASDLIINPRDTLAIARLAKTFGHVRIAWKIGYINSIDPADVDAVYLADLVKNIAGA